MKRENPAPPNPIVEHLPTIFRRIRTGEYRIPPFQRDFVWEEKQVLDLLESVYRGYPIGSVLLWRVDRPVFKSIKEDSIGFPKTDERYPASFVLDGVQRLSSLYGIFNSEEVNHDPRFDIFFDLETEEFLSRRDSLRARCPIPLSTIFHPRAFLDQQRILASLPNSDTLMERAVNLLAVFQEYMVPVVSISERNPTEVVDIFQRINSTGVRLGVVDFMRALTWSDEFDLTTELDRLRSDFEEQGFSLSDETLLKALGIVLYLRPLPDVLLRLREVSSSELHHAISELKRNLMRVCDFVSTKLGMANADALPYEAQWLLLVRLVHDEMNLFDHSEALVRWIVTSSFSEALKGRPDHALVRMIDDFAFLLSSEGRVPFVSIELNSEDLIKKRFLRGKATSVSYIQLLIRRGLFSKLPISEVPYDMFSPIVHRGELESSFYWKFNSARTIGNVVYFPNFRLPSDGLAELARSGDIYNDYKGLLKAQFIDETFIRLILNGNTDDALSIRALEITRAMNGWPKNLEE